MMHNEDTHDDFFNDSSSLRKRSEDEIIDISWNIYSLLEYTLPLENLPKLKIIYDDLVILEDLCVSGCINDTQREHVIETLNKIKTYCDIEINLIEIQKKVKDLITYLKMNDLRSKALILMNQIGQTFYPNNPAEKRSFEKKILPIKQIIIKNPNIMKIHDLTHSIKRIDKLFNENIPIDFLPKEEIMKIIDSLLNDVA